MNIEISRNEMLQFSRNGELHVGLQRFRFRFENVGSVLFVTGQRSVRQAVPQYQKPGASGHLAAEPEFPRDSSRQYQ